MVFASRRRFLTTLAAATTVAALSACGSSTDEAETSVGTSADAGSSTEGAAAESVTLYVGRSESLVGPLIEQFQAEHGTEVRVKYASTPELAATLLEEGSNSPADAFYAQDPGGLGAVQEMLAELPTSIVEQVPDWARSPSNHWVGVSGRARTVVYNTDVLGESDLPDDLLAFTDAEWKGRIGWAPTNASFQTMVTAMRARWGDDKTRAWLEGIQANDAVVYPKNTPIVAAVGAGEVSVGFVNHYYLHRFLAEEGESFAARNYHPRAGGPGSLVMVSGIGILSTAQNPVPAQSFANFLLSPNSQRHFASETFEYPLTEGIPSSPGVVPIDNINHPAIALADLADLKGTQDLLRDVGVLP